MKILYAIQGTGNGHLARATEIVPILKQLADTDVLVSGIQSDLKVPFDVDYTFYGLSFIFGKKGGVDIWQTVSRLKGIRLIRDIIGLPIDKYDLVINDFEPVSAWACRLKGKPCIGLSHQNAVLHPSAPVPGKKDFLGKLILKKYAPNTTKYGFHFEPLSSQIFPPVIRSSIRYARAGDKGHFTVYLPAYSDQQIISTLSKIGQVKWQVFSKHSKEVYTRKNVQINPVSLDRFTESFLGCTGLISTAGFEGPSEALFLKKKLCVIPMSNQYEQHCNAAFLKMMGVKVLWQLQGSEYDIGDWVTNAPVIHKEYPDITLDILQKIIEVHTKSKV